MENLEPCAEFDLIGKVIEVVPKNDGFQDHPLRFRIVPRIVWCARVGVNHLRPELGTIDVPNLLAKHYPEHGPYIGVYAVVDNHYRGAISVGDTFRVVVLYQQTKPTGVASYQSMGDGTFIEINYQLDCIRHDLLPPRKK